VLNRTGKRSEFDPSCVKTRFWLGAGPDRRSGFHARIASINPPHLNIASISSFVPEPSTWAMMILGFAGIGFMAYRQKSKAAAMKLRLVGFFFGLRLPGLARTGPTGPL
jgi:hypothetical protein